MVTLEEVGSTSRPGGRPNASSTSGDMVGVALGSDLFVPAGYVSDSPLSDTATYNQTFASWRDPRRL